jgi:polar amino acid transport system substrate-binding protein
MQTRRSSDPGGHAPRSCGPIPGPRGSVLPSSLHSALPSRLNPSRRSGITLVAALLVGCGGPATDSEAPAPLRAGYSQEPPWAFMDAEGRVTGKAPEILRLAVAEMGLPEVEWVPMSWDELIPALLSGRVDLLSAGHYVTPEREARVRFTRPTACAEPAFLVRAGEAGRLPEPAPLLDRSALRLGVLAGSVEEAVVRDRGVEEPRIQRFHDVRTAALSLEAGGVDVVLLTRPSALYLAERAEGNALAVVESPAGAEGRERFPPGCSAFALRNEDRELAGELDAALLRLRGVSDHDAVLMRFGFDPDAVGEGEP